jgi:hypothetical protein
MDVRTMHVIGRFTSTVLRVAMHYRHSSEQQLHDHSNCRDDTHFA